MCQRLALGDSFLSAARFQNRRAAYASADGAKSRRFHYHTYLFIFILF